MQLVIPIKPIENEETRSLIDSQIRYLIPSNATVDVKADRIEINSEEDIRQEVQNDLHDHINKTLKSYRKVNVLQSKKSLVNTAYSEDPMPELHATGQVTEIKSGIFAYSGELLNLMQKLDAFFQAYAVELGAKEKLYPNVLPVESMMENGYVPGFPHHAMFISMAHQDSDSIEALAKSGNINEIAETIAPNGLMLAPTVCHHCFEELKGKEIAANTIITSTGKCHRFEGPSAKDLSRTHIFNMREIVLFGTASWVHKMRLNVKTYSEALLEKWQLSYIVETATDPFFPAGSQKKRNFQAMNQTKFEIKLAIPYQEKSISAVSVNNHMDTLTSTYKITGDKSLISSCIGFGLERLAFAILCQYGLNKDSWPEQLRVDLSL